MNDDRPAWWARRTGVHRGRIWHISALSFERRYKGGLYGRRTLCGRWADESWAPSWRRREPAMCAVCVRKFEQETTP